MDTITKPTLIHVVVGNNPARCRMLISRCLRRSSGGKGPQTTGPLPGTTWLSTYQGAQRRIPQRPRRSDRHQNASGLWWLEIARVFGDQSSSKGSCNVAAIWREAVRIEGDWRILGYLIDKFVAVGPSVGATSPEGRALAALITQVHDVYIASPNSSDPAVTANQGCMYKGVDLIDAPSRAGKVAEIYKQLDVLESLIKGPYAAGETLTEADFALWPTLACFLRIMMPKVFGWSDVMDDVARPKLRAWHLKVGELPAAQRVKVELTQELQVWENAGKFEPIIQQVKANPDLKWSDFSIGDKNRAKRHLDVDRH
ncbi:unnamed protein product [Prorocentrum cordatum]|uniref:GST C-terminal domain-containing protein n=1 Tax=Prorocentrum cordatum TaxID=2364126 RepID=A0ABN9Q6C2_9DINO|nr:unnamed protein product [Polarella glacialis]